MQQADKNNAINAKVKAEFVREKKMQKLQASLERGRLKALAAIKTPEPEFSFDDEDETSTTPETPEIPETVSSETETELGF
jgi:hypothetical protein